MLVSYLTRSLGWTPTLNAAGRPVLHADGTAEITPELVAAIGYEDHVLGRGTVVPRAVAVDVATTLCGLARLNAGRTT